MPHSITCDMCGDELAVTMVTNLANGDSLAIGDACQLTFHLAVAAELAGGLTADVAAQYAEITNRLVVVLTEPEPPAAPAPHLGTGAADDAESEPPAPTEGVTHDDAAAPPDHDAATAGLPATAGGATHQRYRPGPR